MNSLQIVMITEIQTLELVYKYTSILSPKSKKIFWFGAVRKEVVKHFFRSSIFFDFVDSCVQHSEGIYFDYQTISSTKQNCIQNTVYSIQSRYTLTIKPFTLPKVWGA